MAESMGRKVNWDKAIFMFILLYVILSPVSLSGGTVALWLAFTCWMFKLSGGGRGLKYTPLNVPLAVFTGIVGISAIFSTDFGYSLSKYDSLWRVMIFFLVVNNVQDRNVLKKIITWLAFIAFVTAVIGIIEHFAGVNLIRSGASFVNWLKEDPPRVTSFLSHPVKFGMYMIMVIPYMFSLVIHAGKTRKRLLLIIMLLGSLLALVYTYSRGCWIALFLALGAGSLLYHKWKKLSMGAALVIVSVVVFMAAFPGSDFSLRVRSMPDTKYNGSNLSRISSWERSLRMIKDRPLTGFGWARARHENVKYTGKNETPFNHAHSTLLNYSVETGLAGVGVLLWLFTVMLKCGIDIYRNTRDKYLKAVACGAFCSVLAFILSGLVDYPFSVPIVTALFYFSAGILFAIPGMDAKICRS